MQAATTANVWRGKGKALKIEDFMPRFGPRTVRRRDPKQIEAEMMLFARIHNARLAASQRRRGGK